MRDSQIRLLDLLIGWSQFTDNLETGETPDESTSINADADAIHDLYQEAGRIEVMTDRDVHQFLADKVYPLLCGVKP